MKADARSIKRRLFETLTWQLWGPVFARATAAAWAILHCLYVVGGAQLTHRMLVTSLGHARLRLHVVPPLLIARVIALADRRLLAALPVSPSPAWQLALGALETVVMLAAILAASVPLRESALRYLLRTRLAT